MTVFEATATALALAAAVCALLAWRAAAGSAARQQEVLNRQDQLLRQLEELRGQGERQDGRLEELGKQLQSGQSLQQQTLRDQLQAIERRFSEFTKQNEQQLQGVRNTVSGQLSEIREDNNKQLDSMRQTVDEKLQKTLEERLGQSFRTVSGQLEQVHRGIGEMQTLAAGVGDLKRMMSNVKTRGIWGEVQLSAILEQLLTGDQYDSNVAVKPGSREVVEFAIRLPGDGDDPVWLPIDAKFPMDAYDELVQASEEGDPARIAAATATLKQRLRGFARDIRDKYISPPHTTDFAILFLPTEALYAEVVKQGLIEQLQHDFRVSIAGPTTMGALLNSLQMGFRTLSIQQRSAEVWQVLAAAKGEFAKFGDVLDKARSRIAQADSELEKLVGTRTNVINRALRKVELLEEPARLEDGDTWESTLADEVGADIK